MKKIPCEDCITLAVCRANVIEKGTIYISSIYFRCSLASRFYDTKYGYIYAGGTPWAKGGYILYKFLKDGVLIE